MARTDAFATIRRARTLKERHPDAAPSVVLVALVLATYADGKTGTMIRPGFERVEAETGLSRSGVKAAVRWLEERHELRRDKQGHRGSAACFTYLGVGECDELKGSLTDPYDAERGHSRANRGHSQGPHQPHQPRAAASRPAAARRKSAPKCGLCKGPTTVVEGVASCDAGCFWSAHV